MGKLIENARSYSLGGSLADRLWFQFRRTSAYDAILGGTEDVLVRSQAYKLRDWSDDLGRVTWVCGKRSGRCQTVRSCRDANAAGVLG